MPFECIKSRYSIYTCNDCQHAPELSTACRVCRREDNAIRVLYSTSHKSNISGCIPRDSYTELKEDERTIRCRKK